MKFKSEISNSSIIGFGSFILFFIGFPVYFWFENPQNILINIVISICFVYLAIFFLNLFNTYYVISDVEINYKSGSGKGKIPIDSIKEINLINSIWNFKLMFNLTFSNVSAMGNKGLLIHYGKSENIYISPERRDVFVAELLKINPEIIFKSSN